MKTFIAASFKRNTKKLHRNQIIALEKAIQEIQEDPELGELKVGDLAGIRVYKFRMLGQLILLACSYIDDEMLTLIDFSSHENFYNNLKKQLKH